MTNNKTANAAATLTTEDILDATPLNGDIRLEIDGVMHYVVGADQARNVIFVDPTKDVCTDQTAEICLDDFESLEVIYLGSYALYELVRKSKEFDLPDAVVKNCCPHSVDILVGEEVETLPPTGIVPRCEQHEERVGTIAGIPVTRQVFGEVIDLPEPEEGVFFVVSRMVAAACPERRDLLIPGPLIRDENNNVVGCRGVSVLF